MHLWHWRSHSSQLFKDSRGAREPDLVKMRLTLGAPARGAQPRDALRAAEGAALVRVVVAVERAGVAAALAGRVPAARAARQRRPHHGPAEETRSDQEGQHLLSQVWLEEI